VAERRRAGPLVKWVAGAAALLVVGAVLMPSTTGCYGTQCDGDFQYWGGGSLIDPDTFQTTPLDAKWLKYSHRRMWMIDTSLLGNRTIDWFIVYVSPGEEPNKVPAPFVDPDNYTIAAGNLAEVKLARSDGCRVPPKWEVDPRIQSCMYVINDTCADYYMRLVAHAAPHPPDAGDGPADAGDAGASSDASDAGTDALADAASDAPADAVTE
jgi:hypothetical protein